MSQLESRETARPLAAMLFRSPFMINCEEFEAFIVDYLDGNLTKSQKSKFNLHLLFCNECRDYLRLYKTTIELSQAQADVPYSQMEMEEIPERFINAVLSSRENDET
ncbi:MAG: zf-HC2 domain-containing protein [Hyphomicrobiales bacterium]